MGKTLYTVQDFEKYLKQKQDDFNFYRKNGLENVNQRLIELGRTLGVFPEVWKVKSNRVKGCTSNVFIHLNISNGKVILNGHSDSEIVKGQLAILINGLNMLSPQEIVFQTEQILNNFVNNTDVRFSMTISRANSLGTLYLFIKNKVEEYLN